MDDLLNNKQWRRSGRAESLRKRLVRANKFVLRQDFAMGVDELVKADWNNTCDKIVPLCRLPFHECWFELAHVDRLAGRSDKPLRPYECKIKRVGWLLTETDHKTGLWEAQMFWSFDERDPLFQSLKEGMPINFGFWGNTSMNAAIVMVAFNPQAKTAEEAIKPLGLSSVGREGIGLIPNKAYELGVTLTDWEGEGAFLMGMLALLNSKNVTEKTEVSFKKKNKAAIRSGQLPLFDHHVISIHSRYSKRNMTTSSTSNGREYRSHWCRGHFKIRKTGLFFWSHHRRGNPKLGFVSKNYTITVDRDKNEKPSHNNNDNHSPPTMGNSLHDRQDQNSPT